VKRGDRVELTDATDYHDFHLSAGDRGQVEFTDSLGTIHIRWDNGRRIGILTQDAGLIRLAPDPRTQAGNPAVRTGGSS